MELWSLSTYIIPLFTAIILHEIAHGWMAYKLGDDTAYKSGRLTLNPMPHIDPIGSILLPCLLFVSHAGIMFGWAKPVPVRFGALKDVKKDMGLVALAGPLTNFILAFLSALIVLGMKRFVPANIVTQWIFDSMQAFYWVNLGLCAFNLLPILPLDGGRILVSILPRNASNQYAQTEKYGFWVLLVGLFLLPMFNVDIIHAYLYWMVSGLSDLMFFLK